MSARSLWCSSVLLPNGWGESVLLEMDVDGALTNISVNCSTQQKALADEHIAGVVIPGMANLHSHAHQRAMVGLAERSSGDQDNFWSWRSVMYQMLEQISPDQLYDIARMLYLEMLQVGYTHVAEFQYLHHDRDGQPYNNPAEMTLQCLQAARDVGMGFTALPVLYRYGGFGSQPSTEGQARFVTTDEDYCLLWHKVAEALKSNEFLGIAPHSLRAIDQTLLRSVLAQLKAGYPIHIHIAEQPKEVEDCVEWSGLRPVAWLMEHFEIDDQWCLIHATHLDDVEKKQLAISGATAGLCPTTEANLGDGLFDIEPALKYGGRFGIGSDSQISVSVTEELRWLEYGQRLSLRQRNVIADHNKYGGHCGRFLYQKAISGGSAACGLPVEGLEIGARANFIVLDKDHPRMTASSNDALLDSWIFSAGDAAISAVYVNGSKVIEQGQHSARNEIVDRFQNTLQTLKQS